MNIRYKFIFFAIVLCPLLSFSQISLEIGSDTTYCTSNFPSDTIYLGENIVFENYEEPVQYSWECEYSIGISTILTASDFLNDTIIKSPYFIDKLNNPDWIKFTLHIIDNNGIYTKDSINIRFSNFGYSITNYNLEIQQGDSIMFDGVEYIGGGITPLNIVWTPSHGLTDSTNLSTWSKPSISTDYFQIATDSVGCISNQNPVYYISILTNDVGNEIHNVTFIEKIGDKITFQNPDHKKVIISIFTINGSLIFKTTTTNDFLLLGDILKNPGIYICNIIIKNKIYSLKFIKD